MGDLKPITLDINESMDRSDFEAFKKILLKIGRTQTKSTQRVELLKDELSETLSQNRAMVEEVRRQNYVTLEETKELLHALLDYFDVLSGMDLAMTRAKQYVDQRFSGQG